MGVISGHFGPVTVNPGLRKRYGLPKSFGLGGRLYVKDRMTRGPMTADRAATTALRALAFLAGSGPAMDRFMDLSGASRDSLRERAEESDFLVSVLDFLLSDEELLIRFCDDEAIDVRAVHMARYVLSGGA